MKHLSFSVFLFCVVVSLNAFSENKFFFSPVSNKETQKAAGNLRKKGYFQYPIYMSNENEKERFRSKVEDGDIIEFHADGCPWIAGGKNFDARFDQNPITLAVYLSTLLANKKDIALTVDLRFCNSGTEATGSRGTFAYAEFFSKALAHYGLHNITVWGYAGYLNSPKSLFHQSIGSEDMGSKAGHCSLEQGKRIFRDGAEIGAPQKRPMESFDYDRYLNSDVPADRQRKETLLKFLSDSQEIGLYPRRKQN